MKRSLLALVVALLPGAFALGAEPLYPERLVYISHNLLVDDKLPELLTLIERSAKAGYTGVVLAEYKFNVLGRMPDRYFKNVEKVKKACNDHKIELIPTIFPIGYSDGLLTHDPNLAEGIPVKDSLFTAKDGVLVPQGPGTTIRNGDFENFKGQKLDAYSLQDEPGTNTVVDQAVAHTGKSSIRISNTKSNARLSQLVNLKPWHSYRLSCWIKTDKFTGSGFKLLAIGSTGRSLTFFEKPIKESQDWVKMSVVFNTLEHTQVRCYVGVWSGCKGTIWLDDFALEEIHLTNIVRRPACPLIVKGTDGTLFEEGRDFLPVKDELYEKNMINGDFSNDRPGVKITLTKDSRIKAGSSVNVSYYQVVAVHDNQVTCSLIEPKVFELLEDQAKRVHKALGAKTYFMSHDEIRVAGWCELAKKSGKTPGELLAANVKKSYDIIKKINPDARVMVWSDMFDPNHNAVNNYFLVNGNLTNSWVDLPKDLIIANWNSGKAAPSLKHFADLGLRQIIAGYYEESDLKAIQQWNAAAKGLKGVDGFMYTTWQRKYVDLEAYGKELQKPKAKQ